jgi:hypothetical protein
MLRIIRPLKCNVSTVRHKKRHSIWWMCTRCVDRPQSKGRRHDQTNNRVKSIYISTTYFPYVAPLFCCCGGEGPRSRRYGRTTALRLFVQPYDEHDSDCYFFVLFLVTEHQWNETDREKTEVLGEKPVPVPLCPPQILHRLTQDGTRALAANSLSHGTALFHSNSHSFYSPPQSLCFRTLCFFSPVWATKLIDPDFLRTRTLLWGLQRNKVAEDQPQRRDFHTSTVNNPFLKNQTVFREEYRSLRFCHPCMQVQYSES